MILNDKINIITIAVLHYMITILNSVTTKYITSTKDQYRYTTALQSITDTHHDTVIG